MAGCSVGICPAASRADTGASAKARMKLHPGPLPAWDQAQVGRGKVLSNYVVRSCGHCFHDVHGVSCSLKYGQPMFTCGLHTSLPHKLSFRLVAASPSMGAAVLWSRMIVAGTPAPQRRA